MGATTPDCATAGSAATRESVTALLTWRAPRRGGRLRDVVPGWTLDEAELRARLRDLAAGGLVVEAEDERSFGHLLEERRAFGGGAEAVGHSQESETVGQGAEDGR
mgnify:CR=1 FL=1